MNKLPFILILVAALNSCIGNILLKWSRTSLPANAGTIDKFLSVGFIGGLLFYGSSVVFFAKGLESVEVSVAYLVLAGSGFAMLAVASHYIFGETFNLQKFIGLGLVLGGIIFLSLGELKWWSTE